MLGAQHTLLQPCPQLGKGISPTGHGPVHQVLLAQARKAGVVALLS